MMCTWNNYVKFGARHILYDNEGMFLDRSFLDRSFLGLFAGYPWSFRRSFRRSFLRSFLGLFLVFPPVFTQAFNAVLALRIYEANPKQRDLHILLAKMPDIDNFRPRFREGGLPDECGHIKMHGKRTVHLLPIFRDCHMQSSAINSNHGGKRQKRKNTKNT